MTYGQRSEIAGLAEDSATAVRIQRADQPIVRELVDVLVQHPKGLRRWSVMRAIRNERERASRDIPQKLEADVERIFRRFCAGADACLCAAGTELFFRPEEKAGEVWAVFPDRAAAWLMTQPANAD
jgi:hypothetical protein